MKLFGSCLFSLMLIFASHAYAASKKWASDPVIASNDCESLDYKDVVSFLTKYYYPTLGYSGKQDKAGEEMMQAYAMATSLLLRAQTCMAEALELKSVTDALKKEQAIIAGGTSMSKKEMKKQRKITADASAQIEKAAKQDKELTPEQRKRFSLGAAAYLAGSYATSELFKKVEDYTKQTKKDIEGGRFGGSLTNSLNKVKGTLGTANTMRIIFSGMKDHTKNLYSTSKFIMAYSKQQDIELPSEATDSITKSVEWV